ncbi:MAG TPA: FAD-dependent oxidoreductase [Baekduia sp.]|nr:FAD-dependent oxidoreductase [Baekduia sp.]
MTDRSDAPPLTHDPLRVVIAGGGVAALEALVALEGLAPGRVDVTLVSVSDTFIYRPLLVGEPFGLGHPHRYDLTVLCAELGAALVCDKVTAVRPEAHAIQTASGKDIIYDVLLVALGARPYPAFDNGVTFERELSPEGFDDVLADLTDGMAPRVAIIVPDGVSWSMPAYELALLTAAWAQRAHPDQTCVTLVTHEEAPLAAFGSRVSAEVAGLLETERVVVRCGVHPDVVTPTALRVGGTWMEADRIVSLPHLAGPRLAGLPADMHGFIPSDGLGRVEGEPDVYVAGDCGTFPIKQGGIAAQQAVVAVRDIAARAGADVAPQELEPVLRAVFLTREGPRYLRAELADVEQTSTFSFEPLWWPPSKVASHWLGPYIARMNLDRLPDETADHGPTLRQ